MGEKEDRQIVCVCARIRIKDIKQAIENGATTLEEVETATGAGKCCGSCRRELANLVAMILSHSAEQ